MILVIVESPAKAKTIKKFLGSGFDVDSSAGHIRDLPRSEMGFDTESLKVSYEVLDSKKGIVARLRKKTKSATKVLLATDMDREGEAIAWHLWKVLNPKVFARISFNEITPKALKNAVQNETSIDINMVAAQEARRLIDRYVGYTVSPWLARAVDRRRVSAGRVQTVALRIICEREQSVRDFISEPYFVIVASMQSGDTTWTATLDASNLIPKEQKIRHLIDNFEAQNICDFIISRASLKVASIERKQRKQKAPPAFTTSTLQQAASNALGMTPKITMSLAQKLYEAGYITYMRTDSKNLSDDAIADIRGWLAKFIEAKQIAAPLIPSEPNKWKSAADAQDAHEGIRPSNVADLGKSIEGGNIKETTALRSLYQLIWRRAVSSQMSDAIYNQTIIKLTSPTDPRRGSPYHFSSKGSELVMPGWRFLMKDDMTEDGKGNDAENEGGESQELPLLHEGESCKVKGAVSDRRLTKPPNRFSEAALIKELERQGIGRPSTYAATIETLLYREYAVVTGKKHIVPTDLGFLVLSELVGKFSFVEIAFTRDMESELDDISTGKISFRSFMSNQITQLNNNLEKHGGMVTFDSPATAPVKDCPRCGKGKMFVRQGRSGDFLGCNNYPKCKHSENI